MTAIMERPAPSGSLTITESSAADLPLKVNGRPRKVRRDQNFTVFIDADRLERLEILSEQVKQQAAEGDGLGREKYFRSAAVRVLMDRGFPAIGDTSKPREHKGANTVFTCYMNEQYRERLTEFIEAVKAKTGQDYNRSLAVRDLIDAHLPG